MRTAIVHEWLDTLGGSEKVLEQLLLAFPHADLYVIVDFFPAPLRSLLHGRTPRPSFIQRLPFARRHFRRYLPLMPFAVEHFDLSSYSLVISNSHAVAKGVLTNSSQTHICYCHTPMRYAWDLQHEYLRSARLERGPLSWIARAALDRLRRWDLRTAPRVDLFLTNSTYVAARIRKTYAREAVVIPPPVDTAFFQPSDAPRQDWYFTASRLVPYKRTDLLVEAFSRLPDRKLIVAGDGPLLPRCRSIAGPNIEFLGHVSDQELRRRLQQTRAFLFAAEEDFGILPVEAQACGTPVICYGRGGVLDSVLPDLTGIFFDAQTPASIHETVRRFESMTFHPSVLRDNASRFSIAAFRDRFWAALPAAILERFPQACRAPTGL